MEKIKRILILVLAMLMFVSVIPLNAMAAEQWWMPLTSYVSIGDPFGCTCSVHNGRHNGQDFPAYGGTSVRASKSGTVVAVVTYCKGSHYNGGCSCGSSWGNYVKIKHDDGFCSLYAHFSSVSVSNGQRVSQGQEVGKVGTTGDSTGNHLHFEIYNTSNVRVNPMDYISPNNPSPSNEPTTILYPTNGGVYKIAYGGGNNMYLDFALSSNNVQIFENCDGHSDPAFVKSQYFKLTHVGDGWYSIINVGNGKAIDIAGINPTSGTNIQQWEYLGNDGQLYRFYDAGNGYCYIKSKLGTYIDKKDGDTSSDTNVWSYEFNGTIAQKWKLEKHSHSYSSQVTTAATCTRTGIRTYTCSKCKHAYTETIAKTSHSYTSSVTKQPTCTTTGVRTYRCSCGASYTEKIDMLAHNDKSGDNRCDSCNKLLVNEIIINFEHYSHTVCSEKTVVYGENYGALPEPQRIGFVFDGWYTSLNGGTKITSSTKVTATMNHTLYAHWKTQTVYFDVNHSGIYVNLFRTVNGEIADGVSFDSNTQILSLNGDFSSFAPILDFPFNTAANDVYRVRVDKIDGTISDNSCIVIDALDDNMKNMSNYDGRVYIDCCHGDVEVRDKTWNISTIAASAIKTIRLCAWRHGTEKCECKNIKIKIKIEKIKSTDVYSTEYSPAAQVITHGKTYGELPIPTREGYNFDGWYTSASGGTKINSTDIVTITGDQTLYAHWTCEHGKTEVRNASNPTCTTMGYVGDSYCVICGVKTKTGSSIPAIGHSYIGGITKAPTCTETGIKTFTCSKCSHSYTESIAAIGHTWTAATCTAAKTCSVCKVTDGSALGHNEEIVPAVTASCTATGLSEGKKCSVCEKTLVEQTVISMTEHTDNDNNGSCDHCNAQLTSAKLLGDLDGDGRVTSADARLALRASVGLETLNDVQKVAADVDNDGRISSADARLILRTSVGLETL